VFTHGFISETINEEDEEDEGPMIIDAADIPGMILQPESYKLLELPKYRELKKSNKIFKSEVYSTNGYCYQLIVRPNGLRYTKGFNTCIGIWLKPVQGAADKDLEWPARVELELRVHTFDDSADIDGLVIPMQEYTWTRKDTKSINPVMNFDLEALKHSKIEEKCEIDTESGESSVFILIIDNIHIHT
jgi:hypothetical protein